MAKGDFQFSVSIVDSQAQSPVAVLPSFKKMQLMKVLGDDVVRSMTRYNDVPLRKLE